MKRVVSIVILISMMLHCASRLGVLSYIYSKKHEIAYRIGLIAEIPIAMCDADHFAEQAPLLIIQTDEQEKQLPPQLTQAKEIQLFHQDAGLYSLADPDGNTLNHNTIFTSRRYLPPTLPIFHPPC